MTEYAPNVVVALLRVMDELPAIGKDGRADPKQGGYAYRGIEQITKHCQGLFARHGVVFVPRVVGYEIRDIEVNGKPWTDTIEQVEYDVYGPGGIEDRITVGPILAIGRDNSDKGANKCMTQAYKYALLQALCISDAKDDGDSASHEADRRAMPESPYISPANVEAFLRTCEEHEVDPADIVVAVTNQRTQNPAEMLKAEVPAAKQLIAEWTSGQMPEGGTDTPSEPQLALPSDHGGSAGQPAQEGADPATTALSSSGSRSTS